MTPARTSLVSRFSLIAAAGLIGVALVAVGAARVAQIIKPTARPVAAAPLASIELVFIDKPDGSIEVRGGEDRRLVQVIKPKTGGFVRGVMRGFARDRMARGFGAAPPFMLAQAKDGRLTLTDLATGRVTVLDAFGGTNRAAFASMLQEEGSGAPPS